MPRYDYVCLSCAQQPVVCAPISWTREVTHGMQETPEIRCETCGDLMTRQLGTFLRVDGNFTPKFGV